MAGNRDPQVETLGLRQRGGGSPCWEDRVRQREVRKPPQWDEGTPLCWLLHDPFNQMGSRRISKHESSENSQAHLVFWEASPRNEEWRCLTQDTECFSLSACSVMAHGRRDRQPPASSADPPGQSGAGQALQLGRGVHHVPAMKPLEVWHPSTSEPACILCLPPFHKEGSSWFQEGATGQEQPGSLEL